MEIVLIYFAIKYNGNWDKIYEALENKEKISELKIKGTREILKKSHLKWMTILDIDYPEKLKKCYKPPFVLWYKGDFTLLSKPIASIHFENNKSKKDLLSTSVKESNADFFATAQNENILVTKNKTFNFNKIGNKSLFLTESFSSLKEKEKKVMSKNVFRILAAISLKGFVLANKNTLSDKAKNFIDAFRQLDKRPIIATQNINLAVNMARKDQVNKVKQIKTENK